MSHWQQEPIRYLESSTPQPSETIKSLRRKVEEYQLRLKQQEEQTHRLLLKLQERDLKIKHLEHENRQLKKELDHSGNPGRKIEDSMYELGNVNELQYNVRNMLPMNDLKKFKVEEFNHGGKSNRSFEKNHHTRRSIVQTSFPSNIREIQGRETTPPTKSVGKNIGKHTLFPLFESFMIVQGNLLQLGQNIIDSRVTFSYPNHQPADREKIVPMFCYPRGMKPRILQSEEQRDRILEDVELESSIFLLNSQFTTTGAAQNRIKNDAVSISNPNFNLYGVCLKSKVVALLGNTNYELSKTYVVLTYLPFVRFFLNLIAMTINAIKSEEMNTNQGNIPNIERIIIKSFEDLSRITIDRLPLTLKFKCQGNTLNLSIPEPPYTDSLTSSYAVHCIPKIDINLIVDIVLLTLLEYSIVIYSKDVTLLSQLTLLLMQAIRPLRYPHPVIVNLPKSMQMMLESPFPTMIGITAPLSHIESHSVYFNIDAAQQQNKPDIPSLVYLADFMKASLKNKKTENDILNRMKQIIGEEIIMSAIKQKINQYQPYVELFRRTQIYRYYCQ